MLKKILLNAVCAFGVIFFSACSTPAPNSESLVIKIYASNSIQPSLADAYACAQSLSLTLKIDANDPDISLRMGEPNPAALPIYKIGEEELVVVTNDASPLNLQQITGLFTGRITNLNQISPDWSATHNGQSGDVRVWVFSTGEDMQQIFEQSILTGIPVVSSARIAASPQEMLSAVANDPGAIGYIPRRWLETGVFEQSKISANPIMAILKEESNTAAASMIACLQRNR